MVLPVKMLRILSLFIKEQIIFLIIQVAVKIDPLKKTEKTAKLMIKTILFLLVGKIILKE